MTLTVEDILFIPAFGPLILSMMTREEKLEILRMMNQVDPDLVRLYVNLLFSSSWLWVNHRDRVTGLYQEEAPCYVGWQNQLELGHLINLD